MTCRDPWVSAGKDGVLRGRSQVDFSSDEMRNAGVNLEFVAYAREDALRHLHIMKPAAVPASAPPT